MALFRALRFLGMKAKAAIVCHEPFTKAGAHAARFPAIAATFIKSSRDASSPILSAIFCSSLFLISLDASAAVFKIGGTGGDLGTMRQIGDAFERANPGIQVMVMPSLGSGGGIKAVQAGVIQLAISSRPIKKKEIKLGLSAFPYAKTAIAIVAEGNHGLTELSSSELANMFSGTTADWPDGTPIRVVLRPETDTDTQVVKDKLPGVAAALDTAAKRRGVSIGVSDQETAALITKLRGGVGFLSLSIVLGEGYHLKVLTLDGVTPNKDTIGTRYPVTKDFFLVTSALSGTMAVRFIEFIYSPKGREILERTGHVVIEHNG